MLITGHTRDRRQEVCHGLADVRVRLGSGRYRAVRRILIDVGDSHIRDIPDSIQGDACVIDRGDLAHIIGCTVGRIGPVRERMACTSHGGRGHRIIGIAGDGDNAVAFHCAFGQRGNEGAALRVEVHSDFIGNPVRRVDHGNAFRRAIEDLVMIEDALDIPDFFRRSQVFIQMITGSHGRRGNRSGRDILIHGQTADIHIRLVVDSTAGSIEAHGQVNRRIHCRNGHGNLECIIVILDNAVICIQDVGRIILPAVEGVAGNGHLRIGRQVDDLAVTVGRAIVFELLAVQAFHCYDIRNIRPHCIGADIVIGHRSGQRIKLHAVCIILPTVEVLAFLLESRTVEGREHSICRKISAVEHFHVGHISGRSSDIVIIIVDDERVRFEGDRHSDIGGADHIIKELAFVILNKDGHGVAIFPGAVVGHIERIADDTGIIRELRHAVRRVDILIMHRALDRFVFGRVGRITGDGDGIRRRHERIAQLPAEEVVAIHISAVRDVVDRRVILIRHGGSNIISCILEGHGVLLRHVVEIQVKPVFGIDRAAQDVAGIIRVVLVVIVGRCHDIKQLGKGDVVGVRCTLALGGRGFNDHHIAITHEIEGRGVVNRRAAVGQIIVDLMDNRQVVFGGDGQIDRGVGLVTGHGVGRFLCKGIRAVCRIDPLVKLIAFARRCCGGCGGRLIVSGAARAVEGHGVLRSGDIDVDRIRCACNDGHACVRLRSINGEVLRRGVIGGGFAAIHGGHACRGNGDDCTGRCAGIGCGRSCRPGAVRILNVNIQRDGSIGIFIDRVVNDVIRIREGLVCKIRGVKKIIVAGCFGIRGPAEEVLAFLHGVGRRSLVADRGADNTGRGRGRSAGNRAAVAVEGHGAVDRQGGVGVGVVPDILNVTVGYLVVRPVAGRHIRIAAVAVIDHSADAGKRIIVVFRLVVRLISGNRCGCTGLHVFSDGQLDFVHPFIGIIHSGVCTDVRTEHLERHELQILLIGLRNLNRPTVHQVGNRVVRRIVTADAKSRNDGVVRVHGRFPVVTGHEL